MTRIEPGSWRASAAPIIEGVIARVGRENLEALRTALQEAYPFGQRAHWPYKVWLDECRRQLRGNGAPIRDRKTIELFNQPGDDRTLDLFTRSQP